MTFSVLHGEAHRRSAEPILYEQYIVDNYRVTEVYPMLGTTAAQVQAAFVDPAHDGVLSGTYTLDSALGPVAGETRKAALFNDAGYLRIDQTQMGALASSVVANAKGAIGIWTRIPDLSVWTDGISRNMFTVGVANGANPQIFINKRSTNNSPRYTHDNGGFVLNHIISPHANWFYVVAVWDKTLGASSYMKFYYNGVISGSPLTIPNTLMPVNTWRFNIGGSTGASPTNLTKGNLAYPHYWANIVPTDAEILGVYNARNG